MSARTPRLPSNAGLTGRQREVIERIARGKTNFEIATELGISLETVKYHVSELLARLGVESREEAAEAWRHSRRPAARMRALVPAFGFPTAALAGFGGVAIAALLTIALVRAASGGDESASASASANDPSVTATPTLTPPNATPSVTPAGNSALGLTPTPPNATLTPATPGGTPVSTPTPAAADRTSVPPPTPTEPSPTIAPVVDAYPFGRRTGVPVVDAVIAAAESGDYNQIAALITWYDTNCFPPSPPPPYGAIVCPADDPTVTSYQVASVEYIDGNLIKKDEALARRLGSALVDLPADQRRIYAVVDYTGVNTMVSGVRYRIVFVSGEAVTVNDTGIAQFACGRTSLACPGARTPVEQVLAGIGNTTPVYLLPPPHMNASAPR